jgi:hypothetical protein
MYTDGLKEFDPFGWAKNVASGQEISKNAKTNF